MIASANEPDGYLVSPEVLAKLGDGDPQAGRRTLRLLIDLECSHVPINGPTERPVRVRDATAADELSILALLRLDIAENAAHIAEPDEQRIKAFVQSATQDRDGRFGVIDGPHGIIGTIYLVPEMWWWSDRCYVAERLTFVDPAYRSWQNVADLVKFGRWVVDDMSRQLGYQMFLIGSVVASRDARRKAAVFGKLMNYAGGVYCYPDPRA